VQSIDMQLEITTQQSLGNGAHEVTCTLDVEVLVGPMDGWRADSKLVFVLVPVNGYLRIREIEEVQPFKSGRTPIGAEDSSWGTIKALYR
jgi:hypothetical protein